MLRENGFGGDDRGQEQDVSLRRFRGIGFVLLVFALVGLVSVLLKPTNLLVWGRSLQALGFSGLALGASLGLVFQRHTEHRFGSWGLVLLALGSLVMFLPFWVVSLAEHTLFLMLGLVVLSGSMIFLGLAVIQGARGNFTGSREL